MRNKPSNWLMFFTIGALYEPVIATPLAFDLPHTHTEGTTDLKLVPDFPVYFASGGYSINIETRIVYITSPDNEGGGLFFT